MSTTSQVEISKLSLDLHNYRTTPQKSEKSAIKAMIAIKPDRFFGVLESVLVDGFLLGENIIVLKVGSDLIVKEGNRRVAILKLLHGKFKLDDFALPASIKTKIKAIDATWKKNNLKVPCAIYDSSEADKVDKIVSLFHGKGEKASRDPWSSIAKARHNRDKGISEPGLDLLEKYLKYGKNWTNQQKERWAGDYPITVLDEAIRKIAVRLGAQNAIDLSEQYPKISAASELDEIIKDIGLEQIRFETIRDTHNDFAQLYGIAPIPTAQGNVQTNGSSGVSPSLTPTPSGRPTPKPTGTPRISAPPTAHASNDPKHVADLLKKFTPRGSNRGKVVTIRDEIKKLKIKDNPIAFCFLLRSMFEISAKAYCDDHSISLSKPSKNGKPPVDKTLVELLSEITTRLTNNNTDKLMVKKLHGALTEISKPSGVLSVTSMNQLVHSTAFSIAPNDICILFGNIYPLLVSMN